MRVYWLEQTEAEVPCANDWLSAAELALLNAFRFPKRRADWRLGRWTAKRALAAYFSVPHDCESLRDFEIHPASSGAPEANFCCAPAAVRISLSHRDGVAICAVAPHATNLGCDLEKIEPRTDNFVTDYFTTDERALIAASPTTDRMSTVALLWSAKESMLKALSVGLRLDTRSVRVTHIGVPGHAEHGSETAAPSAILADICDHGGWHPLSVCYSDGQLFRGWWQSSADYVRTMVAAPSPRPPIPI